MSGYVEQFDTHTAASTVYEALLFSGTLRNGPEVDAATTKKFVDQVRHTLCFTCCCGLNSEQSQQRFAVYYEPDMHAASAPEL